MQEDGREDPFIAIVEMRLLIVEARAEFSPAILEEAVQEILILHPGAGAVLGHIVQQFAGEIDLRPHLLVQNQDAGIEIAVRIQADGLLPPRPVIACRMGRAVDHPAVLNGGEPARHLQI